jgi:hypothetical protein
VIRKRLAQDIPAFIEDLNSCKIQCFDAQVFGKSPKQKENVFISNTLPVWTLKFLYTSVPVESLRERLRVETAPVKRGRTSIAPNPIEKNPFSCFC